MKHLLFVTMLATLAACGIDGEPSTPEPDPTPGIAITGRVEMGASKSW